MTAIRRYVVLVCILYGAAGVWFGLVAARPRDPARVWAEAVRDSAFVRASLERRRADSLQASRDTLYRALRIYIMASAYREERIKWLEGRLSQAEAY